MTRKLTETRLAKATMAPVSIPQKIELEISSPTKDAMIPIRSAFLKTGIILLFEFLFFRGIVKLYSFGVDSAGSEQTQETCGNSKNQKNDHHPWFGPKF